MNTEQAFEIAKEVVAYRDAKGFAPTTWETLPTRLCCLYSELEELTFELHYDAPVPVQHELADVAMYALSVMVDLYPVAKWALRTSYHTGPRRHSSPQELTGSLRRHVWNAFEAWRRGHDASRRDFMQAEVGICMELLLVGLTDLRSRVLGFEGTLVDDIRAKIASAQNRPVLHGGKDPRS